MLPAAILAGGRATRLRPLTDAVPKALLPVAGRPFIAWQLEMLAERGVTDVILCLGFLGEQVRAAVGEGSGFGVSVRYSCDGAVPLGTGGALRRALPMLGDAFLVLYGDSYAPCAFGAVGAAYEASRAPALMTVVRNENRWDRSNVRFCEGRILEYDKRAPRPAMAHIDYGVSVLSARALENRPVGTAFDLADLFHGLSLCGQLAGFEVSGRFYEIGSPEGIAATEHYFSSRHAAAGMSG